MNLFFLQAAKNRLTMTLDIRSGLVDGIHCLLPLLQKKFLNLGPGIVYHLVHTLLPPYKVANAGQQHLLVC